MFRHNALTRPSAAIQRGGQLLIATRGRGQLSASRPLTRAPRSAAQEYATTADSVPEWAKDLPAQWQQAAAKPGSSYRRKMKLHFDGMDYDRNGLVSFEDVERIVSDYMEICQMLPGTPEWFALYDGHISMFAKFWSPNKNNTGHSTFDDMIRNMILANNAGSLKDKADFEEFWRAYHLKGDDFQQAFEELDADKDGTVSRADYYNAYYNWFTTPHADQGHGPGKNLWGIVPSA